MLEDKIAYIHEHPEVYFTQEARKGGYICPVCENGTGTDGTGVKLIKGQSFRYKCFKCGTSGDVINFYAAEHHLTNAEAITEVLRMYGLETEDYHTPVKVSPPKVKTVSEVADDLKVANMIVADIELGRENLGKATGNFFFQRRGISKEVALRYNCGFIKNWVHPKLRTGTGDKKIVPSDRMIIPTGTESYVARAVDPQNKMPKLKAGKSNIFNLEVLKTSEQNVVVVEGEFDALSVVEAGNDAIALGTTTNVEKFLNWLKESGIRPKKPLVIDLDADEAGRTAARKLTAGLSKLRIRYYEFTKA
jgi:DNA primase